MLFACLAGPPQVLLIYRVLAVLWNGYISVAQFRRVGFLVLKYYTVW